MPGMWSPEGLLPLVEGPGEAQGGHPSRLGEAGSLQPDRRTALWHPWWQTLNRRHAPWPDLWSRSLKGPTTLSTSLMALPPYARAILELHGLAHWASALATPLSAMFFTHSHLFTPPHPHSDEMVPCPFLDHQPHRPSFPVSLASTAPQLMSSHPRSPGSMNAGAMSAWFPWLWTRSAPLMSNKN